MRPGDETSRESVVDLSRRLLVAAYPDQTSAWIDQQVDLMVQRVNAAEPAVVSATAVRLRLLTRRLLTSVQELANRRGRLWATIATLIVVAGLVAVVTTQWTNFGSLIVDPAGTYSLAAAAAAALVITIFSQIRANRERVLSCRVRINARVDSDVGGAVRLQRPDATSVEDPGVVVARIKNTGGVPIDVEDYLAPLTLSFPGREVVTVDVTDSNPPDLQDDIPRAPGFRVSRDQVSLPRVPLERGSSFKLVVVLSGMKAGEDYSVITTGLINRGGITTQPNRQRIRFRTALLGALTLLTAGALTVVLALNATSPITKRPSGLECVRDSVTVVGSTAFRGVASTMAGKYDAYCPGSIINVYPAGSVAGVAQLSRISASQRRSFLAMSDGLSETYPNLAHVKLAIIPYTFVANTDVSVKNLTLSQVIEIFTGQATVWSQITGNQSDTEPIRVVGRTRSSGTRQTLEQYLLSTSSTHVTQASPTSDSCTSKRPGTSSDAIICERDTTDELVSTVASVPYSIGYADVSSVANITGVNAIQLDGKDPTLDHITHNQYPFWTVEYVYSYSPLQPGTLASAFVNYLRSPDGNATMASFQYFACSPGDPAVVNACNSGR